MVVRIAIGEYPPYSDRDADKQGIVPHLISRAFEVQGYKAEFDFLPWARSYVEGQKNTYDAVAYFFCTPERSAIFYCSEPLYQETTVFFYHKQRPIDKWQGLHDLEGLKIGATQGYSYTADFWYLAKLGVLSVDTVASDEQNFARLLKGHIDAFPMSVIPGNYLLKKKFSPAQSSNINYNVKPLLVSTNHLLFLKRKKQSRRLRVEFNKGLSKLKKSGEYQQILAQYK